MIGSWAPGIGRPLQWLTLLSVCVALDLSSQAAWAQNVEFGVWEGSAECADGAGFYRASTEPGDDPTRSRLVLDILDSPGGQPWARGLGQLNSGIGNEYYVAISWWMVRPLATPSLPFSVSLSEDRQALVSPKPFGACDNFVLKRMPLHAATGGIGSAEQLPRRLTGTIGCDGRPPVFAIDLELAGTDTNTLEGVLTLTSHVNGKAADAGKFSLFGEYQADSGALTMIGDQWIEKPSSGSKVFDFSGEMRDRGRRLIARSNWSNCAVMDLHAPGGDVVPRSIGSITRRPILEWSDAAACAMFVRWADAAQTEYSGSFYADLTAGMARDIAVGLFADHRFVPYFGKPLDRLTAEERKHIVDLKDYCIRLLAFSERMNHSGAAQFIDDFVSGRNPELALTASKFRLLEARLRKEMAELEPRDVGEGDLADLEAQLTELDSRFSELWEVDLAYARAMIQGKIEVAKGEMAARIEAQIQALPDDDSAFRAERAIRTDIARLGDGRRADQQRLTTLMGAKLTSASDAILQDILNDVPTDRSPLTRLDLLQSQLERAWPRIEPFVDRNRAGFVMLANELGTLADGAFDEFGERARGIMAQATSFEEREYLYGSVIAFHQQIVPSGREFAATFTQYADLVDSMKPVPTVADLVAEDGSPTNLGLKLAVADALSDSWSVMSAAIPFDLPFLRNALRVSGLSKLSSEPAPEGGYWCDYDMRVTGNFPLLEVLSLLPYRARFVRQGDGWVMVERAPESAPSGHDLAVQREMEIEEQERLQSQLDWEQLMNEGLLMDP